MFPIKPDIHVTTDGKITCSNNRFTCGWTWIEKVHLCTENCNIY